MHAIDKRPTIVYNNSHSLVYREWIGQKQMISWEVITYGLGEKNEEGKKYFPFLPKYGSLGMLCKWFILLTVNSIANTKLLNVYSVYFKSMYGPVFFVKVSTWKRTEMFSICWSDTGFNLKKKQMQFVQMRFFLKKKLNFTIHNKKWESNNWAAQIYYRIYTDYVS